MFFFHFFVQPGFMMQSEWYVLNNPIIKQESHTGKGTALNTFEAFIYLSKIFM